METFAIVWSYLTSIDEDVSCYSDIDGKQSSNRFAPKIKQESDKRRGRFEPRGRGDADGGRGRGGRSAPFQMPTGTAFFAPSMASSSSAPSTHAGLGFAIGSSEVVVNVCVTAVYECMS